MRRCSCRLGHRRPLSARRVHQYSLHAKICGAGNFGPSRQYQGPDLEYFLNSRSLGDFYGDRSRYQIAILRAASFESVDKAQGSLGARIYPCHCCGSQRRRFDTGHMGDVCQWSAVVCSVNPFKFSSDRFRLDATAGTSLSRSNPTISSSSGIMRRRR